MLEIGQIVGLTGQINWSNGQIKHRIRQITVANNMISPDEDTFSGCTATSTTTYCRLS